MEDLVKTDVFEDYNEDYNEDNRFRKFKKSMVKCNLNMDAFSQEVLAGAVGDCVSDSTELNTMNRAQSGTDTCEHD